MRLKIKYLAIPIIAAIAILSVALANPVKADASGWYTKLVVNSNKVATYLNVRESASANSGIVAKVSAGSSVDIIQVGKEWTLVKTSRGKGYVKNEYCIFGDKARSYVESGKATNQTVAAQTTGSSKSGSNSLMMAQIKAYNEALKSGKSEKEAKKYALTVTKGSVGVTQTASSSQPKTMSTSVSSDTLTLLAGIIMCEAGGESYEGQVAVGAVVMNRVRSSRFPNTISEVIYQRGQFTPAGSGKLDRVIANGNITSSCYSAAQAALNGQDNTGGCLYFHAGGGRGLTIGNQTFY